MGDHTSNGVIVRLIYTVKAKLMAMSFNETKPALSSAIDEIIWIFVQQNNHPSDLHLFQNILIDHLTPSGVF